MSIEEERQAGFGHEELPLEVADELPGGRVAVDAALSARSAVADMVEGGDGDSGVRHGPDDVIVPAAVFPQSMDEQETGFDFGVCVRFGCERVNGFAHQVLSFFECFHAGSPCGSSAAFSLVRRTPFL